MPVIRVTLLAGVVLFGAVAIYLVKSGTVEPLDESILGTLRMAFVVLLGATAVAMFVLRRKRLGIKDGADPAPLNIAGWALGEAIAFFGGILLILSGDVTYFLIGFVMMLVSFVFFPIPPDR